MDFLSFRITSSYIVPFSCTYNGHQKSNCLLISSKLDVVKSLWNRLQSIVPDRIENGEKPCISKDFLVLCFTSRCRIGATPKRNAPGSNPGRDATKNAESLDFSRFSALLFCRVSLFVLLGFFTVSNPFYLGCGLPIP